MPSKNPIIYYVIHNVNSGDPIVRAVHQDGTTRDWHKDDRGYKSARSRANASFKRR